MTLWSMKFVIPDEDEAITNGIHLMHLMKHPSSSNSSEQAKSWIGKRVAIGGIEENGNTLSREGILVKIEFVPGRPAWPIVISACPVGTVKSVDIKRKIIYIRVKPHDYHIESTG
jgi:hypothetical protein